MIGVYAIFHVPSGRPYVGSSRNIFKRWTDHAKSLRRGRHHALPLQEVLLLDGIGALAFVVLEVCEISELAEREQVWIDSFESVLNGTKSVIACSLDPVVANKIRKSLTGRPFSEERKAAISAGQRQGRRERGGELTAAQLRHLDKLHTALHQRPVHPALVAAWTTPKTPEHRAHLAEAARKKWTGRVWTPEQRAVISAGVTRYYANKRGGVK